ncbi:MAG: YcxB family protein [Clostridia bacterium]|nr:YcxB family protein [Clostridia bacterium]
MRYSFDVEISEKDYYEFNFYHLFNSERGKKSILRSRLLVPAIFLIYLLYYTARGEDFSALLFSSVIYLILSLIWFFTVKPLEKLILKLRITSLLKKEKRPYASRCTMEFYDEHFVEVTEDSKSESKYDALYKVAINEGKAIYLYRNSIVANLIPFGVFKTEAERSEFLDFINKKTNKEKEF